MSKFSWLINVLTTNASLTSPKFYFYSESRHWIKPKNVFKPWNTKILALWETINRLTKSTEAGSWQGKQHGATYSTVATFGWGDLTAPPLLVLGGYEDHIENELIQGFQTGLNAQIVVNQPKASPLQYPMIKLKMG